jgi:hypothetical protein
MDNPGDIEEHIVLFFTAEKYLYDIRWDRMFIVAEGPRSDLTKKNGPLMHFFTIFNQMKDWPTFGTVQNILFAQWNLQEHSGSLEEIKTEFSKSFFSEKTPKLFSSEQTDQDYVITLQNNNASEYFKVNFGPFDYKTDITTHNLSPILKKNAEEYKDLSGIISEHILNKPVSSVNFDNFVSMQEEVNAHCKKLTF